MPRFTLERVDKTDTYLVHDARYPSWDIGIVGTEHGLLEAWANIAAFALNAVADGQRLFAGPHDMDYVVYDGPTEGVAP